MMINDLVRNRDITVIGAFLDGFKVYNPKGKKDEIVSRLQQIGWKYQVDIEGNIRVYNRSVHVHGHGFKQDMVDIANSVQAETHEIHHVPDLDSYEIFRDVTKKQGLKHSEVQPANFQVMRIDASESAPEAKYKKIAELNPSYVLIKLARKYGKFYNGWLELVRATMLRREGANRADGLMARSGNAGGVYERTTVQQGWNQANNPNEFLPLERERKMGPSMVERNRGGKPRSKPIWSAAVPETPEGP
jgi:hypothetical protein